MVLIIPFGALTLFLDSTHGYSLNNRRKVARIACLTIFITISFFTLAGETLLKLLVSRLVRSSWQVVSWYF